QGLVAAVLLVAGGLQALQTMSVASALPFAVIMLVAAFGMWRALSIERHRERSLQAPVPGAWAAPPGDWTRRLDELITFPSREEVQRFIDTRALDAMRTVGEALRARGWP